MELTPGALIAGRYRVERKVGEGGMGEVWAGEHVAIGVRVALKRLLSPSTTDRQVIARFKREAQLLGRLRSDHVARVVDFVTDASYGLVLVMDFVEGESLAGLLSKRRLSVEEAIDVGVDVVRALCDLHRASVVHRDLKPDNIILEPQPGGVRRAVLVDFGVGRVMHRPSVDEDSITDITHADTTVGTIPYMAPEQVLSSRDVTGRSDIYALGAILYRSVTGQQVFGDLEDIPYAKQKLTNEAPPLDLPRFDRVAKGFAAIVARALKRKPDGRFATAEEMLAELTALRDVARVTAIDLEATTVAGPISTEALGATEGILDDETTTEETRRMSVNDLRLPAGAVEAIVEPPPPSEPAPMSAPVAPPPPSVPAPEPQREAPRGGRSIPMRAAIVGMIVMLVVGAVLGFAAHRQLAARPAASAGTR